VAALRQRGRSLSGWYPSGVGQYPTLVPDILIASDASRVWDEVGSVLAGSDFSVHAVPTGAQVRSAFLEVDPDLVILDQQVGSMGAFAICYDLRLEAGAGRAKPATVLVLLDRRADVFLARRCNADGWLLKPLDAVRLRRAVKALLAGGTYEDTSYLPHPVLVASASDTLGGNGK
jgi:DNA-binding response OmpR family regulator